MYLVQGKFIAKLTIKKYVREVTISNKIRAKYFIWDGQTIKAGSKKLWKKCINPKCTRDIILNNGDILPQHLHSDYIILGFKGNTCVETIRNYPNDMIGISNEQIPKKDLKKPVKYFVCYNNNSHEKVIANPTQVGKPRTQVINGNYIYNHTASPFTTGKIFDALKEMYYRKFKSIPLSKRQKLQMKFAQSYPLMITMEVRDTVKNYYDNTIKGHGRIWDVGNRSDPYMKTFLDFLTKGLYDVAPLIEEDDRLHVTTGNNSFFTPIELEKDRALVFYFYHDDRNIFKKYLE